MTETKSLCPCGSSQSYKACCEPYIKGEKRAPTAEALMRSRYSAYVKHEIEYVGRTHDPKSIHEFDAEAARNWAVNTDWKGLEVVSTEDGLENDETGVVEFIARFAIGGNDQAHHEISVFRNDGGTWYYVDGKTVNAPVVRTSPKVGRNDACPCGSGKKFKKCCAA